MAGAGSGTLAWIHADVTTGVGDSSINAAAIIDHFQGAGADGRIIQVFDGGNATLQLNGAVTGLTLTCDPSSGEGNILFRSSVNGVNNALGKAATNLELQLLIRF
tara:strand:+ start:209 stop:523 length:315 start_codon:yes stop_codon:yes gene_type:complete